MIYYNDNDRFCCEWLANLIGAGHLPAGHVCERDIRDVRPSGLEGFEQCHFFAGLGGWPFALKLAGWPVERRTWTGSCPCQDFSVIGKRHRFDGNRDLWPVWFKLIGKCNPDWIFGEQVDGCPEWFDRAATDLESLGYAVGAVVVPALAVGAPHERARLYFVAHADQARWSNLARKPAAETQTKLRRSAGVVCGQKAEPLRWPTEPDDSWIVDGLPGAGLAVGAYGNAIVPQLAAQFIKAVMECDAIDRQSLEVAP
jgi:DNA (cytosine-5)-methyltransferase 1